jgi:hypothetical protein
MSFLQNLFPDWAEFVSVSEQVFDCSMMLIAVFLVGLRDA